MYPVSQAKKVIRGGYKREMHATWRLNPDVQLLTWTTHTTARALTDRTSKRSIVLIMADNKRRLCPFFCHKPPDNVPLDRFYSRLTYLHQRSSLKPAVLHLYLVLLWGVKQSGTQKNLAKENENYYYYYYYYYYKSTDLSDTLQKTLFTKLQKHNVTINNVQLAKRQVSE